MIGDDIRGLLVTPDRLFRAEGLHKVPSMTDGSGADSGGINALPRGQTIWRAGTDSNPATMILNPAKRKPGQTWEDTYQYNTITRTPPPLIYLMWELQFALSDADLKGNAREFEAELCEAGWTDNMALQYKWSNVDGPPAWRMFDQTAPKDKWVPIPHIPPPWPKAGVFTSVKAFFVIDRSAGVTYHDSIIIDGVTYYINTPHKRMFKWPSKPTYLHNAAQIDSLGDGATCGMQIRDWNVRGM